jgi:CHASE2 domain-containing sensor protein
MSSRGFYYLGVLAVAVLLSIPLAVWARDNRAFGAETRLSDNWFRTRAPRAPRADEIIVALDQKTLDAMRPTHADYANVVRKLKEAGAKWIVLDLDLGDRQGKGPDGALWQAIQESHRTLVLVRYAQDRTQEPDPDELRGLRALERSSHWQEFALAPGTPEWGWLNFAPATSDFIHSAHGAGVAVTEQSLDPDATLRQSRSGYVAKVLYPSDTKQGKLSNFYAVVPNLAVITAVSAMGGDKYSLHYRFGDRVDFGGAAWQPLDKKGLTPIDYIGPEGRFPRVSMVDLLRSNPDPALFKDKIVFVGATAPTDDRTEYRMTPYGSRMPRVEVTANLVQSTLDKRPLTLPHVVGFTSVLALGLLLGLLTPAFRSGWSVLGGLLGLFLYLLMGWILFTTHSVMVPLLPAFILTPVVILAALALNALFRPWAEASVVTVRDTGMATGPGEDLPDATPRRRWPFRRRGPI